MRVVYGKRKKRSNEDYIFHTMQPDERKALAIKLNDVAMAAIGYERVPEKKDLKVGEGRRRVNADT